MSVEKGLCDEGAHAAAYGSHQRACGDVVPPCVGQNELTSPEDEGKSRNIAIMAM